MPKIIFNSRAGQQCWLNIAWSLDLYPINANFMFWHIAKIWNSKWISGVKTRKFPPILGDRFLEIGDRAKDVFVLLPKLYWEKITKLDKISYAYWKMVPSTTILHLTSTLDYPQSHVICRPGSRSNVQQRLLANYEYMYGILVDMHAV